MERTQDYQKKSLIDMFEWKYYLSYKNDKKRLKSITNQLYTSQK